MKLTFGLNMIVQLLGTLMQIGTIAISANVLSEENKIITSLVVGVVQSVVALLSHFKNPDGTPAAAPYVAKPTVSVFWPLLCIVLVFALTSPPMAISAPAMSGKLMIMAMPQAGQSNMVSFVWNASTTEGVQEYALFCKDYSKGYDFNSPGWSGNALTASLLLPSDRQSACVARCWKYGPYDLQGVRVPTWSENSNEVVYSPPSSKPDAPGGLMQTVIAAVKGFFDGCLKC